MSREAGNATAAIVDAIGSLGSRHGGMAYSWRHTYADRSEQMVYAALVFLDNDAMVENDEGELCKREGWQRDNLVMAVGTDPRKVAFDTRQASLAPSQLTLWFDRIGKQFHLGPRCTRTDATGRPLWADRAVSGDSPFG
jgi:hypothetical protein